MIRNDSVVPEYDEISQCRSFVTNACVEGQRMHNLYNTNFAEILIRKKINQCDSQPLVNFACPILQLDVNNGQLLM